MFEIYAFSSDLGECATGCKQIMKWSDISSELKAGKIHNRSVPTLQIYNSPDGLFWFSALLPADSVLHLPERK
jgi:hypothetical protein